MLGVCPWRSITVTCPVPSLLGSNSSIALPDSGFPRRLVVSSHRRQSRAPPDNGGSNAFFGFLDRSISNINPYGNLVIRADGLAAWKAGRRARASKRCVPVARRRRSGWPAADLHRTPDAGVAGCALHPDGRILAIHRLSEGCARRDARLLCGILWVGRG